MSLKNMTYIIIPNYKKIIYKIINKYLKLNKNRISRISSILSNHKMFKKISPTIIA